MNLSAGVVLACSVCVKAVAETFYCISLLVWKPLRPVFFQTSAFVYVRESGCSSDFFFEKVNQFLLGLGVYHEAVIVTEACSLRIQENKPLRRAFVSPS